MNFQLRITTTLTIFLLTILGCNSTPIPAASGTKPPSHQIWNGLLQQHVDSEGMVNYQGFLDDREELNTYLNKISNTPPDPATWTREEQLAYWINAYNAFTVKLIVDNYPLKSIQDLHPTLKIPGINTVWHKKFFKIGGEESSLDQIEHDILRKQFNEPRIHFAINCASFSCPLLRNEAFTAENLDKQLNEQAAAFINDPKRNQIKANSAELSKIFNWFTGDFTENGSLTEYLNKYSQVKIQPSAKISYMEYDWSLNEQ
jgi:hypothetical protein